MAGEWRSPGRWAWLLALVAGAALVAGMTVLLESAPSAGPSSSDAEHVALARTERPLSAHEAGFSGRPRPSPIPPAPPGWAITAKQVLSANRHRYYLLARPLVSYGGDLPILVVLHGRGMTPAGIEQRTGFLQTVGRALVVYPAGMDESWNAGYCCGEAQRLGVDDVAFLETVIHQVLASEPPGHAHRVYLVGYSNGGRMAYRMACADPGAFSGLAAVEAVAVSSCGRAAPVPLLEVASTGDPLLTIPGNAPPKHVAGHSEITVTALVDHWRDLEQCSAGESTRAYRGMEMSEWAHCDPAGRVALAVYAGGSHKWPAGGVGTPSATRTIWSFFQQAGATSRP